MLLYPTYGCGNQEPSYHSREARVQRCQDESAAANNKRILTNCRSRENLPN